MANFYGTQSLSSMGFETTSTCMHSATALSEIRFIIILLSSEIFTLFLIHWQNYLNRKFLSCYALLSEWKASENSPPFPFIRFHSALHSSMLFVCEGAENVLPDEKMKMLLSKG